VLLVAKVFCRDLRMSPGIFDFKIGRPSRRR
jgi:hypothetical protein